MAAFIRKIKSAYEKNKAEAQALVTGRMPSFVYGVKQFRDIPVFCFHSVKVAAFENQLQFLNRNGYRTLTSDELFERLKDKDYKNDGKEIVLTFDDGMASVWTVAYPLLKKYNQKIISFILPGLMDEGKAVGNNIDDVNSEQEKAALSERDFSDNPLCNWKEVIEMHESGFVDFQSHGMFHSLISVSPKIIDFIHPKFDAYHYGNIFIPVYHDAEGKDSREKVLGYPVYQHATRLSGKHRYLDSVDLRQACAAFVKASGGEAFFEDSTWRSRLKNMVREHEVASDAKKYESTEQMQQEIIDEVKKSKVEIEKKLNKTVSHFCFPWFVGSDVGVAVLKETGYLSAHLGETNGFKKSDSTDSPLLINRVQAEYLLALPGDGSHALLQVLKSKIIR
jgi:peptidoglycan/xylan/chitin deacetylase (PgdA/CDA1 family)